MSEPRTYLVKTVFATVQGEGYHAGTPAVFVRLVGCNLWSGRERDRERDAARHGAACPRWCDTDFTRAGAERLTAQEISARVREAGPGYPLVVVTGGEPLLQLDAALVREMLTYTDALGIAVETNGTVPLSDDLDEERYDGRVWITCSPKVAPSLLRLQRADEVKVVLPDYAEHAVEARERLRADRGFVQPRDPAVVLAAATGDPAASAHSLFSADYEAAAAACRDFVHRHPSWRVSTQTHKLNGYP